MITNGESKFPYFLVGMGLGAIAGTGVEMMTETEGPHTETGRIWDEIEMICGRIKNALDYFYHSLDFVGAGLVTSYTLGGFIHILLIIAVVVLALNLIQGRRVW